MKMLKQLRNIFFSLLLILFICYEFFFFPTPFIVGKFGDKFKVIKISRDTVFRWERFSPFINRLKWNTVGFGVSFTITAKGNLDDSAKVYFQYVDHPNNSSYSCVLPKGKVDTAFYGEI